MQTNNTFLNPPEISIKQDSCIGCGLCARVCPVRIYKVINENSSIVRSLEECCLCGQCLAACPNESIVHSGFNLSPFKRISNDPINSEIAFDFLSQRRSVRNYRKDIPPRDLIEKIIEISGYAPGSPHQRVGWVRNFSVVYGYDNMKHVLNMTVEYMQKIHKLIESPLVRMAAHFDDSAKASQVVLPDIEMRLKEYEEGRDAILYNAPIAIFAHAPISSSMPHSDCCAAILYVQLYAHAHGIGTCWNGLLQSAAAGDHLKNFTKLSEFLKIPKGHKCYAAATAGYPSVKLHSTPKREINISWIEE